MCGKSHFLFEIVVQVFGLGNGVAVNGYQLKITYVTWQTAELFYSLFGMIAIDY